jgi:hypothetical protein
MRGRAGYRIKMAGLAAGLLAAGAAQAASYEFVPAPQADLNRVYRVDKATGEVISCQYGLQENTIGTTLCFGPGEGAGPQAPSEYSLVASRHLRVPGQPAHRRDEHLLRARRCRGLHAAGQCRQRSAGGCGQALRPVSSDVAGFQAR